MIKNSFISKRCKDLLMIFILCNRHPKLADGSKYISLKHSSIVYYMYKIFKHSIDDSYYRDLKKLIDLDYINDTILSSHGKYYTLNYNIAFILSMKDDAMLDILKLYLR